MQHRIVRRVSLGLAAGLAAAAWVFAIALQNMAPGEPSAPDRSSAETPGAAAFAEYCASCHEAREWSGGLPDAATAAALITYLKDHGGASLPEDLLILQWLADPGTGVSSDQLRTK
jgi:mono/diheme cytochrome c family protein